MIHAYAFAEGLAALPACRGLDGAALERLDINGIAAVFSRRLGPVDGGDRRAEAVAHGAVVEALVAAAAVVLPVRFGESAADDAALESLVRERLRSLRSAFERVRGCVEVGVRVWAVDMDGHTRAENGAAYMRSLRASESRRRETFEPLHRRLSSLSRETRRGTAGSGAFAAAYLVPATRLSELRRVVDDWVRHHPEASVVCTGPWAPFSFTEAVAA
jgi:hypothetical protein